MRKEGKEKARFVMETTENEQMRTNVSTYRLLLANAVSAILRLQIHLFRARGKVVANGNKFYIRGRQADIIDEKPWRRNMRNCML